MKEAFDRFIGFLLVCTDRKRAIGTSLAIQSLII